MAPWDGFAESLGAGASRPKRSECEQRKPLKAILRQIEKLPRSASPAQQKALADFVREAKTECLRKCGGCELTRGYADPAPFDPGPLLTLARGRRKCRAFIKARLEALAKEQADGRDVEIDSASIAAHCTNCGKCPKLIAGMAFMLHPRRSGQPPGSR